MPSGPADEHCVLPQPHAPPPPPTPGEAGSPASKASSAGNAARRCSTPPPLAADTAGSRRRGVRRPVTGERREAIAEPDEDRAET